MLFAGKPKSTPRNPSHSLLPDPAELSLRVAREAGSVVSSKARPHRIFGSIHRHNDPPFLTRRKRRQDSHPSSSRRSVTPVWRPTTSAPASGGLPRISAVAFGSADAETVLPSSLCELPSPPPSPPRHAAPWPAVVLHEGGWLSAFFFPRAQVFLAVLAELEIRYLIVYHHGHMEVHMRSVPQKPDFRSLSIKDLLEAREVYHVCPCHIGPAADDRRNMPWECRA